MFDCKITDLGKVHYKDAYDFQKKIADEVKLKLNTHMLILCEHFPVITLGRVGKTENLLTPPQILAKQGIDFFKIDRGGDITAHEPGQITAYPIFDLKLRKEPDIRLYLDNLQEVILTTLSNFGIEAQIKEGKTGVWVKNKKIASIGISISRWVTCHGLTINVNNDLNTFYFIRPCDMDIEMTSLAAELGREIDLEHFKQELLSCFSRVFKLNFIFNQKYQLEKEAVSAK